jgi:hypothetical protein
VGLGSRTKGRLEDTTVRRCVIAAGNRSRVTSGLTQGGRQQVRLVGLKDCLCQILLWRSNRPPKWNVLGKRDSWAKRKLWKRI